MAAVTKITMHNSKRRVLIASLGLAVVSGLVLGLVPEGSPLDWLLNFVIAIGVGVLILVWCHYDSHQHGRGVGSGLRVLIILLGPFALWLYLARTRPLKQALAAIGLSFALVFGLLVLSSAIAAGVALTIGPLA